MTLNFQNEGAVTEDTKLCRCIKGNISVGLKITKNHRISLVITEQQQIAEL